MPPQRGVKQITGDMAQPNLRPLPYRKRPRRKRKRPGDPKYYDVIDGNGYWQPGKGLRELGYYNVPCGPDGPDAIAIAENLNREAFAKRAIVGVARAVRDSGPMAINAMLEAWSGLNAERLQRSQTIEFEPQTGKFEPQTEEFEAGGPVQTLRKRESASWLRWISVQGFYILSDLLSDPDAMLVLMLIMFMPVLVFAVCLGAVSK